MKSLKASLLAFCLFLQTNLIFSQSYLTEQSWVDSILYSMDLDQKIGQLFMVRAYSKSDPAELNRINNYIDSFHIGGICFFQGSPQRQVEMTNSLQAKTKTPLFISIDGEWGVAMRYPESVIKLPKQLTIGAIMNDQLVQELGETIAKQCKRMGIHFNFGPVLDINNNPKNAVINERSFGEDKYNVITKATAYVKGLQSLGVLATAKHFPGHGDTHTDSHAETPVITHSKSSLQDVELMPFKALIGEGVASIMIGHINVPSLDDRPKIPASLSYKVITELLREEMGYDGLVFTDAMEMKGVPKMVNGVRCEAEAFLAGVDIILMPDNLATAFRAIKKLVLDGTISPSRLDESVRRILKAKYTAGLHTQTYLSTQNVVGDLNNNEAVAVKTKIIENAITMLSDDRNVLPYTNYGDKKFLSIAVGAPAGNTFHKRLSDYAEFNHNAVKKEITLAEKTRLLSLAASHTYTVMSIHDMSRLPTGNYGITNSAINLAKELSTKTNLTVVIFGNPYASKHFESIPGVMVAYEDDALFQDVTAQALFGVSENNGRLPITASPKFFYGEGISKNTSGVLGYAIPEAVGLSSSTLDKIDNVTRDIIRSKAAPGCVVLVAKDNKIVYQKAFGTHTYIPSKLVDVNDLFDLASVTKILSGTLSMMKLYETNKVDINSPLSNYIPETRETNKGNIILSDMMAHQARLIPFIPFYEETVAKTKKKTTLLPQYYKTMNTSEFDVPVAPFMYMHKGVVDTIWNRIYQSPLRDNDNYRYSDLGFYLVGKIIKNVSAQDIDNYANINFYKPLGLKNTMYNPIRKIPLSRIVPSDYDDYFRGKVTHGYVHDMGAAMLGGVSGHAGLFSNAKEVAVLMQMLLNKGSYGGKTYLQESTVKLFTTRHSKGSRRALGFDMRDYNNEKSDMSPRSSYETFGHTGFTGTCTFADPKNNLIYVFLSNRTFPNMENNALNKNDYREKIHDIIYQALK
jgi:beta-N-acetylhexosaminidase